MPKTLNHGDKAVRKQLIWLVTYTPGGAPARHEPPARRKPRYMRARSRAYA